jgi:enoyl-CoA hydratase/carnithine racemase
LLQQIDYSVADGIATITLDRPEALNAFTGRMMHELIEAFDLIDADDDVRAVVVTGRGRGFCAGADMASGGDGTFDYNVGADGAVPRDGGGQVALRIFDAKKPVIAAINGPAVGVGITMMLPADIRIASTGARFGFVFARRGIAPEACSSWFLPRIVGISKAAEWVYSGRVFDATEALAGGLVRSLHEPSELLPAAYALARDLTASSSGVSVALSRQMLWRMLGASHPMEAHRADSRAVTYTGKSADAREGISSFFEKRAPHFTDTVSTGLPPVFPDWVEPDFH